MEKVFVVWYLMPEVNDEDIPPVEFGGIFSTAEKANAECKRVTNVLPDAKIKVWYVEYEVN
jgi:hypothetical protein